MARFEYRIDAREIILGLVKNPLVYLRVLGVVFSIVVFGCLADKAYAIARGGICLINDSAACDLGIAAGVLGMLTCLGSFTFDILYIVLKQNKIRSILLFIDAAVFILMGIFWFVSFCIMLHHWARVDSETRRVIEFEYGEQAIHNIQAAIVFAPFNVVICGAIILLNVIFVIRGPGFPWKPKSEEATTSPSESGYVQLPERPAESGNYQPPEP